MVSVHGFVEAAQHAVGVGMDSSAVEMCSQAIVPNAQSKFKSQEMNTLIHWPKRMPKSYKHVLEKHLTILSNYTQNKCSEVRTDKN